MPTPPLYAIRDWKKHFENNRTAELKHLHWVPFPTKHDGDGYTSLLDHPDGAAHFGAWCALVQVAARCGMTATTRGRLLRDLGNRTEPHTPASLARITRIPENIISAAIVRLCEIGWLEQIPQEGAIIPQVPAAIPQEGAALLSCPDLSCPEQQKALSSPATTAHDPTPIPELLQAWNDIAEPLSLPTHPRSLPKSLLAPLRAFFREARALDPQNPLLTCQKAFLAAATCYAGMDGPTRYGLPAILRTSNRGKWLAQASSNHNHTPHAKPQNIAAINAFLNQ